MSDRLKLVLGIAAVAVAALVVYLLSRSVLATGTIVGGILGTGAARGVRKTRRLRLETEQRIEKVESDAAADQDEVEVELSKEVADAEVKAEKHAAGTDEARTAAADEWRRRLRGG